MALIIGLMRSMASLSVDGADGFGRSLDIGEQDGGDPREDWLRSLNRALDLQGVAAFSYKIWRPSDWTIRSAWQCVLSCRHFLPIPRYTGLDVECSL